MTLASIALINLVTKEYATIAGVALTVIFFALFTISERINSRNLDRTLAALDQFQLQHTEMADQQAVGVRPGNVAVAVRDYNTLWPLGHALDRTNTEEKDVVVMTTRMITGPDSGERNLYDENLFTPYEQQLFTQVVAMAERRGKPVDLLIVPTTNIYDAIAQTALRLDSSEIIVGRSSKMTPQEQAREFGRAWEMVRDQARREVRFKIVDPDGTEHEVSLGAHAPRLTEEDINLIHDLWLQVSNKPSRRRVHHRDVVRVALNRLKRDLRGQADVMLDFYKLEQEEEKKTREKNNDGRS
jgi:hypothetical protein